MSTSQKNTQKTGNPKENNVTRYEEQILDTSSVGVLITRINDGTILYANKAIANLLGIADAASIIGMPVPNFYWDAEDRKAILARFRAEGSIKNNDLRARRADDSMIWVSISIHPFSFEGEQVLLSEIADISERKQAETALKESEEKFRAIADNTAIGLFVHQGGIMRYLGSEAARLLGYDITEDVLGHSIMDFIHPDERQRVAEMALQRTAGEDVPDHYETRLLRKDGSALDVILYSTLINYEGKPATQGAFLDITERKQVEMDLLLRDRALASSLNAVILINPANGQPIYINDALLKMTGYSREEVTQLGLSEITGDPEAQNKIRSAIQSQGSFVGEELIKRKDGSSFYANFFSSLIVDDEGRPIAVQTSFFDISERKQAEEAVRESEERFKRFTEATVEGLVFHEQGKVVDVNPAAVKIFGLTNIEDLIGRNLLEFIRPEFHQLVLKQMQLESVTPYEILGIRKDGSAVPVETSTRTYKIGDRTIRASSIRDITERKHAEQALQENQRLLQLVMDNIPQAVFWKDKELTYLGTNQAFAEDAGFHLPQDLVGKSDFDMPWKEQAELYRADDQRVLELGEAKLNYEEPQTGPTGEKTWLRTSKIPMRDVDGKIFAILGMYEDITEQKRLQQKVEELFERRGYQVQVGTEISQEVAAASELSDLFDRVVTLTKERLGYYHTQLLRYDASQDAVVLINGYGETGKKMLTDGHQMPMGKGLIGTAAASGETVLRPTLADDPDWHSNPLLPDTQGEIAVPIKWQNTVLGVLDVQSNQAGALSDEDRLLLEGLCGQIAIAMHSAELVETIHQNEARLAEALRAARLANWEYDVEKDLFTFNDEFYSIFHTTAEKAGGYQISSARYAELFVHPDDMNMVGTEIGKALSSTDRVYNTTLDHRILYQDGGVGYITVKVTVERDENGKITRYYGANQDITERKQAEEALRINEARLSEALRMAKLAYWEHDLATNQFIFNDEYYAICHTTAEQEGGYTMSPERYTERFIHPDDRAMVSQAIAVGLQSTDRHFSSKYDQRLVYLDGNGIGYMTVETNIERDESGNIVRVYGSYQDITERKQAEEALRINEARLAEALEIARLAHWEYDVEKDIFTFNDQFYSLFHTTAEQHGGYQLPSAYYAQHFVYPEDLPVVGAEIEKALNSTERHYSRDVEHRILFADGSIGHMQVSINVDRDENGKITRYYGANQDITERIKVQEEMAERLEEINRLYQNLSHEGWKTYRETEDLPTGFMYDQTGVRPIDEEALADELFANVPMRVLGGEIVGTLAIANDPNNPTSVEDQAFLEQVSEQVALALESARLTAQTQSALAQSEKLFETSRILTQAADLQELTSSTVTMLGAQEINRAVIATFNYDHEGNIESLDIIANWWNNTGHEATPVGTHYPLSVIRAMSFFVSPTPVFFNDTFIDERVDDTTMKLVKNLNLRAVAVLPLHTGTRQIGALILEAEEPHNFTQDEIRLFSSLAPQISTVLENRRQFERAQQQAERESTLNVISQKIQSATTVEAVLQIAARELGHALGAPMTIAQLSMKDKN